MAKFEKKRGKSKPEISTASLPDIIFILIFFFMVVTVMREVELMVDQKIPEATELTKIQKKSLVSYIYIGRPIKKYAGKFGTAPLIQMNDAFGSKDEIARYIEEERFLVKKKMGEKFISKMIVSLRVDSKVKMGIVSDVKLELRKVNATKVNYSAIPSGKKE
jgi:biopolymer transport protein ExbD